MVSLYLSCHRLVTRPHGHKPNQCKEWTSVTTAMCGRRPSQTTLVCRFVIPPCGGHLRCNNKECEYLNCRPRIFQVNEREFEGYTLQAFVVDQSPPTDSTIVCKVCKESSACIAKCGAKIYYVVGKSNQTRACIHLGTHDHPLKVGDYRDTKAEISGLIEEQIEKTPQATKSAVVLEASKVLIGNYLLQPEDAPSKKLTLEELVPVFDRCKDMASQTSATRS